MKTFVSKRKDVSPTEGEDKYGDVTFADAKNKKYPIDTEAHIRAAWNYINKSKNSGKYGSGDVASIKAKIVSAWKSKIDKAGPPSTHSLQEAVKDFMGMAAETMPAMAKRASRMFDDILSRKEAQDAFNVLVWSVNDSLSDIQYNSTLTDDEKKVQIADTIGQFVSEVQKRSGDISEAMCKLYEELETELRTYADPLGENSNTIRGVEIFGAGTHNGDPYTDQDIDELVTAFKELDYRPAIKIGHSKDEPGSPAYGWVTNLKRVGSKLLADFESMHDSVVNAIRNHDYDRCSSEIYFNLERGGKKFRRALKAVALLGAEVPAVANLVPLHKVQFVGDGFEGVRECEVQLEVPTKAIVDSLAERVSGLTTLIKESTEMNRAEELKKLRDQHAEMLTQIKELKDKVAAGSDSEDVGADNDADDIEEAGKGQTEGNKKNIKGKKGVTAKRNLEELETELKTLSEKIEAFEAEDSPEIVELRQQAKDAEARAVKAEGESKAVSARVARLEQSERLAMVGDKIKACKVPAFRSLLEPLYHYALTHAEEKIKVYSKDKDNKDVSQEIQIAEMVDRLVGEINSQSAKLFTALAASGSIQREEGHDPSGTGDASKELLDKVDAYKTKNADASKGMKYEQIVNLVLKAEPELAKRYRQQISGGREQ